jgi:hypothetical protein
MKDTHMYDRFRNSVRPALNSKREEFMILGYGKITEDDLWGFMKMKKWRKTKEDIQVHEIIQSILSAKINDYMTYATVEAFKESEFTFSNEEDLQELLK